MPTPLPTSRRRPHRTPAFRLCVAAVLTTALSVVGTLPATAAPAAPADPAPALAATAAEQARAAVAKGLDKGPGTKAPQGAPYPAQKAAPTSAKAERQNGPKLDTDATEAVEVTEARTRTTRTLSDPVTGNLVTDLASESLNYQDDSGAWQPIQADLVPAEDAPDGAAGWTNGDNRFDATFPTSLAQGPVVVADAVDPARSLSLRLLPTTTPAPAPAAPVSSPTAAAPTAGAPTPATPATPATATTATRAGAAGEVGQAPGDVQGAEVTYPDAAGTGLDVAYEAGPDAVKETITLDSPAAATALAAAGGSVSFALSVGKGLTPKLTDATPMHPAGSRSTSPTPRAPPPSPSPRRSWTTPRAPTPPP